MSKKIPTFSFHIGNIEIKTTDIDYIREVVEEIYKSQKEGGFEFSKHLSDFLFDVEQTYQSYYNLNPDNWDIIKKTI